MKKRKGTLPGGPHKKKGGSGESPNISGGKVWQENVSTIHGKWKCSESRKKKEIYGRKEKRKG